MGELVEDNDLVKLNIGGSVFHTMKKKLNICRNLRLENQIRLASGEYFIDRDPRLFRYILQYLRDNTKVPTRNRNFLTELWKEAQYYGIDPLIADLEKKMNS